MHIAFVHLLKQIIEYLDISVVRKTEIADNTFFAFVLQILQHTVVEIACMKIIKTAATNGMQQQIVDIIGAKIFERVLKHFHRLLVGPCRRREVRQFRRDKILVARMTRKSFADSGFGVALAVGRRCIEIVYAVLQSIVNRLVDSFLIERIIIRSVTHANSRETHAAVAEE